MQSEVLQPQTWTTKLLAARTTTIPNNHIINIHIVICFELQTVISKKTHFKVSKFEIINLASVVLRHGPSYLEPIRISADVASRGDEFGWFWRRFLGCHHSPFIAPLTNTNFVPGSKADLVGGFGFQIFKNVGET